MLSVQFILEEAIVPESGEVIIQMPRQDVSELSKVRRDDRIHGSALDSNDSGNCPTIRPG